MTWIKSFRDCRFKRIENLNELAIIHKQMNIIWRWYQPSEEPQNKQTEYDNKDWSDTPMERLKWTPKNCTVKKERKKDWLRRKET